MYHNEEIVVLAYFSENVVINVTVVHFLYITIKNVQ